MSILFPPHPRGAHTTTYVISMSVVPLLVAFYDPRSTRGFFTTPYPRGIIIISNYMLTVVLVVLINVHYILKLTSTMGGYMILIPVSYRGS